MNEDFPPVLDATCSSRIMWFDKSDPLAVFMDIRKGSYQTSQGVLEINPDVVADFTKMPFPDETFSLVVFDPPHHTAARLGSTDNGDMAKKYGRLFMGWEETLSIGFTECFRVLKVNGVLIFKWFDGEIPIDRVLSLTPIRPLFGHKSGKKMGTHWIAFLKFDLANEFLGDCKNPNRI